MKRANGGEIYDFLALKPIKAGEVGLAGKFLRTVLVQSLISLWTFGLH